MREEHGGAPKGQAEGHRPDPSAREMDVLERITRANLVVSELCDGTRRWTMSIPVRPDDDADIVIGRALHESTKEITSLRAQLAAAEGQARGSEAMLIQAQRDCDNAQNAELVALSQLAERDAQVERMKEQKDGAYLERNQVVAALASCFPSGVARTAIEGWSEDWHGCVYIDLPTGQASWHYHDSQAFLFAHLPPYTKRWDGHTTPEKYQRLAALATGPRATEETCPTCHEAEGPYCSNPWHLKRTPEAPMPTPNETQEQVHSIMLRVGGKSFRCTCGCNCFHHPKNKTEVYECNACGTWYVEDTDDT